MECEYDINQINNQQEEFIMNSIAMVIMDGVGIGSRDSGDMVYQASTPHPGPSDGKISKLHVGCPRHCGWASNG